MSDIVNHFNGLDDPRTGNACRHKFCDLMAIALLCALCGGETAVDMADFAQSKEDFLREFLELPGGLPRYDTFSRVFRLMEPSAFEAFFAKFRTDLPLTVTPRTPRPPSPLMVKKCGAALIGRLGNRI